MAQREWIELELIVVGKYINKVYARGGWPTNRTTHRIVCACMNFDLFLFAVRGHGLKA